MPVKTRHRVMAAMIVAKVEGAQGGEVYLKRGRYLPAATPPEEVKRLTTLGLIERIDVEDTAPAKTDAPEPYKGVSVADLKADLDKRNETRADDVKIVPAEPGNRPEIVAALVADDAKQ